MVRNKIHIGVYLVFLCKIYNKVPKRNNIKYVQLKYILSLNNDDLYIIINIIYKYL